jgi:hypothetical protein
LGKLEGGKVDLGKVEKVWIVDACEEVKKKGKLKN